MSIEAIVGLIPFIALVVAWAFIPTREEEAVAAESVQRASAAS